MGCDVHVIVEVKTDSGWLGLWSSDQMPRIYYSGGGELGVTYRDYDIFGRLAGVRGGEGPAPKGWPDDMSPLARHADQQDGGGYHSKTWYTLEEALQIYNAGESWAGRKAPFGACDFTYDARWGDLSKHRVLFAFDN